MSFKYYSLLLISPMIITLSLPLCIYLTNISTITPSLSSAESVRNLTPKIWARTESKKKEPFI